MGCDVCVRRGQRQERKQRIGSEVYLFARAAATMNHRLGSLDHRNSLSHILEPGD